MIYDEYKTIQKLFRGINTVSSRVAMLASILSFSILGNVYATENKNTAAKIGDYVIKRSEVLDQMKNLNLQNVKKEQIFRVLREQLIGMHVILDEAKLQGFEKKEEFTKALKNFTDRLMFQMFMKDAISKHVTQEKMKEAFSKLQNEKQISYQQIFVKTENTAKRVIKALDNGADFAEVAKKESMNPNEISAGPIAEKQLPAQLRSIFQALKSGAYTTNPIKIGEAGYVVLKITKREDLTEKVAQGMLSEKMQEEAISELMKTLQKKHQIQRFDIEGKEDSDKNLDASK